MTNERIIFLQMQFVFLSPLAVTASDCFTLSKLFNLPYVHIKFSIGYVKHDLIVDQEYR